MNSRNSLYLSMVVLTIVFTFFLSTHEVSAQEVVAQFVIPDNSSGLAWDGEVLWTGGTNENGSWLKSISHLSGEVIDSIPAPIDDCYGLTWHGDRLVYLSAHRDSTYLIDHDGSIQRFLNPYPYLSGLASDGKDLWTSNFFSPARTLIKMDDYGRVLASLPFTGRHCRDLAFHHGWIYASDMQTHQIRVVDPGTGTLIDVFDSPADNPAGIASDGHFIWLIDDGEKPGTDLLYKIVVRQSGGIRYKSLFHDFGSVPVDKNAVWRTYIYNDGIRTATMVSFETISGNDDILFPGHALMPDTIAPGDSVALDIFFGPAYSDSVAAIFEIVYDIDRIANRINVRGRGVGRDRSIDIINRDIDFGDTRQGIFLQSSSLRYLLLDNVGGDTLVVDDIEFSDDSFFNGFYDFPHTFSEPGLYPIPIFFKPNSSHIYRNETLTVTSNDTKNPEITVNLSGRPRVENYPGGEKLWEVDLGSNALPAPKIRGFKDISDATGDILADIVVATNDYKIHCYHAASTFTPTAIWTYETDVNPWRNGSVTGPEAISGGGDWDSDGTKDIVFGLDGGALSIVALSGRSGKEIWVFDTHHMRFGGGIVTSVNANFDFTGDGIEDVIASVARKDDRHSTNTTILLNGRNGRLIWDAELDSAPKHLRMIKDHTGDGFQDFFIYTENGLVIAYDGKRGQRLWDFDILGEVTAMVIIDDVNGDGSDDLAMVTNMSGITMINGSNGIELWYIPINVRLQNFTAAVALNDINDNGSPDLVLGDGDNWIRAIDGRYATAAWDTTMVIGAPITEMAEMADLNHDGYKDFFYGTHTGRLALISGEGTSGLWNFQNEADGHDFVTIVPSRDIDGNNQMDVFASMAIGRLYCFAGSYIGDWNDDSVRDENNGILPRNLILNPAYPNPFNSSVVLPIKLNEAGHVKISVFDLLGRNIYSRRYNGMGVGSHALIWNGSNNAGLPTPSGIYLIDLQSDNDHVSEKVHLIR